MQLPEYTSSCIGWMAYSMLHKHNTLGRPLTSSEVLALSKEHKNHRHLSEDLRRICLERANLIVRLSLLGREVGRATTVSRNGYYSGIGSLNQSAGD